MKKTVPDRSRTFAVFGQIIDEIFQSNAKNDVTKTISCLNWTKQGPSTIFTFSFVWFKSWPLVASASLFDTPSSICQCTFTAPMAVRIHSLVCFYFPSCFYFVHTVDFFVAGQYYSSTLCSGMKRAEVQLFDLPSF